LDEELWEALPGRVVALVQGECVLENLDDVLDGLKSLAGLAILANRLHEKFGDWRKILEEPECPLALLEAVEPA